MEIITSLLVVATLFFTVIFILILIGTTIVNTFVCLINLYDNYYEDKREFFDDLIWVRKIYRNFVNLPKKKKQENNIGYKWN